jgi:hypothetical protein
MSYDMEPVDSLVNNIVGTTNFISKILFNKASFVAAAAVSLVVFLIFMAS